MSNRRRPRATSAAALRRRARCPDCNSDVTITAPERVQVSHDATCPRFRAVNGGQDFSVVWLVPVGGDQ